VGLNQYYIKDNYFMTIWDRQPVWSTALALTRITQVWALLGSVRFVVLSSLLTKFILEDLWSLVQGLGPTFPMDLVSTHTYLGVLLAITMTWLVAVMVYYG